MNKCIGKGLYPNKYYSKDDDDLIILSVNGVDVHNNSCLSEYLMKLNEDMYYMNNNSLCVNDENIFCNIENFYIYNDVVENIPPQFFGLKNNIKYLWNNNYNINNNNNMNNVNSVNSVGALICGGNSYNTRGSHDITYKIIKKRKNNDRISKPLYDVERMLNMNENNNIYSLNKNNNSVNYKGCESSSSRNNSLFMNLKKKKESNDLLHTDDSKKYYVMKPRGDEQQSVLQPEQEESVSNYVDWVTYKKIKTSINTPLCCKMVNEKYNYYNISYDLFKHLYDNNRNCVNKNNMNKEHGVLGNGMNESFENNNLIKHEVNTKEDSTSSFNMSKG